MASNSDSLFGIKRPFPLDSDYQTTPNDSLPSTTSCSAPLMKKFHLNSTLGVSKVASEEDLDKKTLLLQNQMQMQRLREYSSREEDFQQERTKLCEKGEQYDNNYNYIKSVWQSFNSDLKSLLNVYSLTSSSQPINSEQVSDDDSHNSINFFSPQSNLFRANIGSSFDRINDDLTHASKISRDIVDKLLDSFTKQRQNHQTLTLQITEKSELFDPGSLLKQEILKLQQENNRLLTQIQVLYNDASCAEEKSLILQLQLNNVNDQLSESKDSIDNLKFDLDRALNKVCNLEHRLSINLLNQSEDGFSEIPASIQKESVAFALPSRSNNTDDTQLKKREQEDEWRFLAETRLQELEDMGKILTNLKTEMETRQLGGKLAQNFDVKLTPIYKSLQTQYTLVCAGNIQHKNQCDELKKILQICKQQYTSQLGDLLGKQSNFKKEALEEISRLENELSFSRRECDSLRIDFDGRTSSCDQAILSNRELEATINSLRGNLRQVRHDLNRYRNQSTEAQNLADSLQEDKNIEREKYETRISTYQKEVCQLKDIINELRSKLRDLEEEEGEVKEHRKPGPSVEILELKRQLEEKNRELSKRREDYEQRLQSRSHTLKEEIIYLRQQLQSRKQEQELFMKEMDVTGQAYEDEQERVSNLLKQIKEKDDANFKLMSERIKLNQLQKRMTEEREIVERQSKALELEGTSSREVISRLEERDRKFELSVISLEKESDLKDQLLENFKKKSQESTQYVQDIKFKLEEALRHLNEVEKALLSKTVEYELEVQKSRRIQEDLTTNRRKFDKLKRQQHSFTDEILMEEVKTYKAELTCPCCSQRKKDHILTKCFHVFCGECIKMRYETRQRKCPKCNANFGNNDWHKIYLT